MMQFLGFIGITSILFLMGWIVAYRLLRGSQGGALEVFLGLPLGSLINVLAIALLTLLSVPLSTSSILPANIVVTLLFLILVQPFIKTKSAYSEHNNYSVYVPQIILVFCGAVLAATLAYAVTHALLPTFHYDSLTNWNMRSKVSYLRAEMIFDTQNGLVGKPHYPFLYHALQITAMQLQNGWNDMAANAIHLLLTASSFTVAFILLSRRGAAFATVVLAVLAGIPLLSLHAGQSYADITLVMYAVTAGLAFIRFRESGDVRMLMLSGLLVAAGVWTKTEGLFFCYLLWVIMVSVMLVRTSGAIKTLRYPVIVSLLLSLSWPVFSALKGLSLTPHGADDAVFSFSPGAINAMAHALFVSGSFGIFWYAILLILLITVSGIRSGNIRIHQPSLLSLLWGLLAMLGYMGVYLFTSNTQYLILGQSFDRQMLLPAALLTISLAHIIEWPTR